ncbi:serine/threonine protein phosphatase 1 [Rhizomicrobium palustre]|uniref:Serine/threonine protein phosphatase 1 n=1 Tax=Rhizomicrobium palustre TaxID=189966 RepID=A0A846MYH2_9PROT|nr:metallophosphoesterase family protein [Rhizomicrobium palustre]NIK88343.1 serine/threonine protein phosphatase 1 [Rhizomicrobium palustre]
MRAVNGDEPQRKDWITRLFGAPALRARVPDSTVVYAIGDVHGRFDLLYQLLLKIFAMPKAERNVLIFLGDYIDRGPSSREVIELLLRLKVPGWEIIPLAGNHEISLLEFLQNPAIYPAWKTYGADLTLLSYGVRPPVLSNDIAQVHAEFVAKFPKGHAEFLSSLQHAHTEGDYFFVHAGVRPGVALEKQSSEDLLWIREEFLACERSFGKVIVHGHTPCEAPVVLPNRIGIDTGAYASNRLTAIKLYADKLSFLSADDNNSTPAA